MGEYSARYRKEALRSAAVGSEGGARGEQSQDTGAPDTSDTDPVPNRAALGLGRLRRCSPAYRKREVVGDLVLDDCSRRFRWSGCGGVRPDRLVGDPLRYAGQSGRNVARRYQRGHGDIFIVSWLLRADAPGDPGIVAIVLYFVAVGLASLGGLLGGELVVRLGVGVAEGAHLNAPSSLSERAVGRSSTGAERRIGKVMSGS